MAEEADEEALRAAVSAVYAVAPADFVATRKEWVARLRSEGRKDTAKEVAGLRKPSVSAAAVNALVRAQDPVVEALRDVGARLRHAQSAMDAAGLTGLRGERDELLRAWVTAAREHAAAPLTGAVESEVRDTAVAALADAEATELVLGGTLTRALSYSGFGEVDVADAVARTSTGVVLTRIDGGGQTAEEDIRETIDTEVGSASDGDGPAAGGDGSASGGDGPAAGGDGSAPAGGGSAPQGEDSTAEDTDLEALRSALQTAESEVEAARERRRAEAEAATSAQDKVRVAEAGVDQARRLLAQAEQHAAKAQQSVERAREAQEQADEQLTEARARRDAARTALEEAEDR
ncbi:hypothetical protein BJF80_04995 [Serinicoccus sp. CUA-874]|uniref:hypothetical protein n=1 Tax=Serinicoccus sp. CUA-874 TaxID=1517939 RepID=UPI00095CA5B7|nr:hypothetical protein [Serinicoccus sp. CUA-874]OLT16698.1 hypothetical protein BJF80_04995 [Serinicoccus sp. CUA-874]